MKKLWITILILTILLFSCDDNIKAEIEENENIVLEAPAIMMEKKNIEGSVIEFDEVKLHTDVIKIKVYDPASEKIADIYSEPRKTAEILKSIPESELSTYEIMRHEYIFENDQFILWDAYVLDENVMGYTISSYESPLEDLDVAFYFDDRYEIITNDFPHAYRMKMENYYFYYRFGAISPYYYVRIINPISGEWVKFFVGIENIIFNEEGNMFFVEAYHFPYEPRDTEIQLFALENNKIVPLYNEKMSGYGFKNIKWNSNTEIEFDNYMSGGIDYFDVSYQDLYSHQKLTVENGNVTKFEDNNQYEINKLRDDFMDNDEIILYEDISNQLKVIDKIYYSEIASSHLTRIFSFVDSEIVIWYKIKTKNGIEAYTYRKNTDNEEFLIYTGFLLIDDNNLLEVSSVGYLMRDDYKDLGYYLLKIFDIGHYYKFINKDGIVDFYTNYDPIISPTFHFIASTDLEPIDDTYSDPYQEKWNRFEILAFNQLDAEKMYSVNLGEWIPKAVEWIGDYEIGLRTQHANDGSEKYYHFYFLNGEWNSEEFPDANSSKYYILIDIDVLNIRNKPGMDASIVEKGYYDDQYIVLDIQTDEFGDYWYKIGENKWIASRYCRFSFNF